MIFKTVLRCFKKYYNQDFNKLTEYKKLKRRVAMRNRDLKDIAEEYISKKFPHAEVTKLAEFIQALVSPKDLEGPEFSTQLS